MMIEMKMIDVYLFAGGEMERTGCWGGRKEI